MNIPWPALLVICATLLVIILVLFWHPKPPWTKTSTSAERGNPDAVFRDD
jgi:hypothetical protein